MKGRTPTADEKRWMDAISQLGCIVCKRTMAVYTPAEIHHLEGKTSEGCHFKTIPLCYEHHRSGKDNILVTARHPHKFRFERRYGLERHLLEYCQELINE
tara:strand:- start:65 stop:364 length:300 start_codon:yes stop_codon:yes gene_type:complete